MLHRNLSRPLAGSSRAGREKERGARCEEPALPAPGKIAGPGGGNRNGVHYCSGAVFDHWRQHAVVEILVLAVVRFCWHPHRRSVETAFWKAVALERWMKVADQSGPFVQAREVGESEAVLAVALEGPYPAE